MNWSAKQYVAFEDERTRPVRDLVAALPDIDARAVADIGCGPGNSTEVLASRFPQARVSGIDSSPDMIAAARRRLPGASFALEEVQSWSAPGPFDVIVANAVLQWVPHHETLLPALISRLAPRGALAVQMPDNLEPRPRLMREIADEGPWARLAQAAAKRTVLASAPAVLSCCGRGARASNGEPHYHVLAGGAAAVVRSGSRAADCGLISSR